MIEFLRCLYVVFNVDNYDDSVCFFDFFVLMVGFFFILGYWFGLEGVFNRFEWRELGV